MAVRLSWRKGWPDPPQGAGPLQHSVQLIALAGRAKPGTGIPTPVVSTPEISVLPSAANARLNAALMTRQLSQGFTVLADQKRMTGSNSSLATTLPKSEEKAIWPMNLIWRRLSLSVWPTLKWARRRPGRAFHNRDGFRRSCRWQSSGHRCERETRYADCRRPQFVGQITGGQIPETEFGGSIVGVSRPNRPLWHVISLHRTEVLAGVASLLPSGEDHG